MKIFDIIRNLMAVLAAVILIAAGACFALHLKPAVVMSDSMAPTFKAGSMVLVQMGSDYEVGDAVAFHSGQMYVTHRIVAEEDGLYTTKGDNNEVEDTAKITAADIDGKILLCIPLLGYVIKSASTKPGIIVIAAVIICLVLSMFMDDGKDGKKRGKAKNAAAETDPAA